VEAPTWALVCVIYGGWLVVTYWWRALPVWVVAPAGAWLCAWHMSLQHELMHGHPTRSERINGALAWPPLNLWLPYAVYRESHLRHHCDETLTDPLDDPESTYMAPGDWAGAGPARRWLHGACNTGAGRLLLGPAVSIGQFWRSQWRRRRDPGAWLLWLSHAAAVSVVLAWVCLVCRIGFFAYVACCVYPGTALIMFRSLVEHRAAPRPEDRTAVVEQGGLLGLLYLFNNLHVLHHARPGIPWYALPGRWRAERQALMGRYGGPVYRGYGEVVRRFALRPQHAGPYPGKEECSFLKKRTKKLLFSGHGPDASRPWSENKSLLLFFFRKEENLS
jgi:fatty acid desaturase